MARNTELTDAAANAGCAPIVTLADGGKLNIYDGSQPATGDTQILGQNLLVSFDLPNPAFGAPSSGLATANAITKQSATASGNATWLRIWASDGSPVMDGTVGTEDANLILNSTTITEGLDVTIDTLTFAILEAGR